MRFFALGNAAATRRMRWIPTAEPPAATMQIFSSRPYPIYVETSMSEALNKVVSHLANGSPTAVDSIMKAISDERLQWRPPAPRPTSTEVTAK